MGTHLWHCVLLMNLLCCSTERPGHQHHGLISHSVKLSWQWVNRSLPYSNNVLLGSYKYQCLVIELTQPGFEAMGSSSAYYTDRVRIPRPPKRETDAIWQFHLFKGMKWPRSVTLTANLLGKNIYQNRSNKPITHFLKENNHTIPLHAQPQQQN